MAALSAAVISKDEVALCLRTRLISGIILVLLAVFLLVQGGRSFVFNLFGDFLDRAV